MEGIELLCSPQQQELEKDQQCVDSLKAEIEQENAHHDEQSAAFQQELSDLADT